ncbi:LysR substrate-binding domain-containing protein [Bradyrhizobium sp. 521_C7_N1_3]|uniref:LysR substrate-binding domain-containing protein n=1 Tax=Bradyrhizobium TaxID=374 RepID=UPI0027154B9E|nr:LysR substrate-binding domain-containing protein [Bradyrhizobium japonicum]WLB57632.1 LysR substrate-binding domain-containing protein [Bradyrhizobium japonicum]WLB60502.1 LysR substrate-binding domain-containing protein [Bradyrhizobium japonicum]
MSLRLPSLNALRAFEAVGRTGSIKAASDELSVSPTVVSRHIRKLQLDLNVALVAAHGRGLLLTAAGEAFHARVTRAFDILRQANEDVRPASRRTLTIWCIPGIINQRLLARLPALMASLPNYDIALYPTLSRADFTRGEADAEIVHMNMMISRPKVRTELIAAPKIHAVASPTFRARHPVVTQASDFLNLPLIHEASTLYWEQWFENAGVTDLPMLRGPHLWHAHLTIEAARQGQGVALANALLVEEDLAAGRLVDLSPHPVSLGGYYFVAVARRWGDPELVVLRRWLKEAFQGGIARTIDAAARSE